MVRMIALVALGLWCSALQADPTTAVTDTSTEEEAQNGLLSLLEQHRPNLPQTRQPDHNDYYRDPLHHTNTALKRLHWSELLPLLERQAGTTMFLDPEREQRYFATVNPESVTWVATALEGLAANPQLQGQGKAAYRRYLFPEVRIFYRHYLDYRDRYDEWDWAREMAVDWENRFEYAERISPYDSYERNRHLMFWIRRDLDGSMEALAALLRRTLEVYDPVFLRILEDGRQDAGGAGRGNS